MKEFLSQNNVEYTYLDIDDEEILKQFYAMRDQYAIYDSIKAAGRYGIPTLIIDGEPVIDVMKKQDVIKAKLGLK